MSVNFIENNKIAEAYSFIADPKRYERIYNGIAKAVFGEVNESVGHSGKYEKLYSGLAKMVFNDVNEDCDDNCECADDNGIVAEDADALDGEYASDDGAATVDDADDDEDEEEGEISDDEASEDLKQALLTGNRYLYDLQRKYPELTAEEERDMVADYLKRGDREGLDDMLVLHNSRLISSFIGRYFRTYRGDVDAMVSMGIEAMIRATKTFDPNRGLRFKTFAWRALQTAFDRYRKYGGGERIARKSISMDRGGNRGDDDDSTFGDYMSKYAADKGSFTTDDERKERELKEIIDGLFDAADISDRDRRMIVGYSNGHTFNEIAAMCNFNSLQSAQMAYKRSIAKLRKILVQYFSSSGDMIANPDRLEVVFSSITRR